MKLISSLSTKTNKSSKSHMPTSLTWSMGRNQADELVLLARQQPVAGLQAPSGDIGGKGIRQLHVVGARHY
jgi:hypothetical protein